jgi:hypothetical protein
MDSNRLAPEKEFDCPGWKIASFDPNDLGRGSETLSQVNEVPIRANQCGKLRSPGPLENERIG